MENSRMIRASILPALAVLGGSVCAASPIWQRDWTNLAPPTLAIGATYQESTQYPTTIAFADNGDVLVAGLSYFGDQSDVLRLLAHGPMSWVARIPADRSDPTPRLWPADDGGVFVSSYPYTGTVKMDASGAIEWTRKVPSQWFAVLPGGRIGTADCKHLTALAADSGRVEWQVALPVAGFSTTCDMSALQDTPDHGLIFSIKAYSVGTTRVSHTFKADSSGRLLWQHTNSDETARLIGVDAGKVFLATDTTVIALDAATGSPLWQTAPFAGQAMLVAGTPGTPVVVSADAVRGLAPDDGSVLWNQKLVVRDLAAAVGGALMLDTAGGLVKLAVTSGQLQWTTTLPETDLSGHPLEKLLAVGGLHQGQFSAVARVQAADSQPPPFVQRIDFLSGQLSSHIPLPSIVQGNSGNSVLADGHLVSMSVEQGAQFAQYRLSLVDVENGTEEWGRVDPPVEPALLNSRFGAGFLISASDDIIVAAISEGAYPVASAAISVWERTDGAPRWRTELPDADEEWRNTIMSTPVITHDTNVLVSTNTYTDCEFPDICAESAVYELNGVDGSILWRHSESTVGQLEPPHLSDPLFMPLNGDVAVAGSFSHALKRLNGTDGSVLWTADTLELDSMESLHLAKDGNLIAVGFSRWAKFDADSGAMLWSAASPRTNCYPDYCSSPRTFSLPDGNLLQVGSRRSEAGLRTTPLIALLHSDGSGTHELWFPMGTSALNPQIHAAEVDSNGNIWMMIRERLTGSSFSLWSLTRFDPESGEFMGRQVLTRYADNVITPHFSLSHWLAPPEDSRLPVLISSRHPPAPTRKGIALLDTSVSSTGNLSVGVTLPPSPVMPGEIVPFQVTVHFEGSSILDAVGMDIALPWGSGISAAYCSAGSEAACRIETYDGDLHAEFSIEPGGSIVIGGEVAVLDSAAFVPRVNAVVHGPIGLMEQNILDNFASIPVVQSLFRDGFEAPILR